MAINYNAIQSTAEASLLSSYTQMETTELNATKEKYAEIMAQVIRTAIESTITTATVVTVVTGTIPNGIGPAAGLGSPGSAIT